MHSCTLPIVFTKLRDHHLQITVVQVKEGFPGFLPCLLWLQPWKNQSQSQEGLVTTEKRSTRQRKGGEAQLPLHHAASHMQHLKLEEETAVTSDKVLSRHHYNRLGNFATKIRLLL